MERDELFRDAVAADIERLLAEIRAIKSIFKPVLIGLIDGDETLHEQYAAILGGFRAARATSPEPTTSEERIALMALTSAAGWLDELSRDLRAPLKPRAALGIVEGPP